MKSSRQELFTLTSFAFGRRDGVISVLIEWWVENHLDQNELCRIADDCDFSSIDIKRDGVLGRVILKKKDLFKKFHDDVDYEPITALMMKLVMEPVLSPKMDPQLKKDALFQIDLHLRARFANAIGYQLTLNGWLKKNQSRIAKERANYKTVKMIHES